MKKIYVIYDYRALTDVDNATIYGTEDSLEEAIESAQEDCGGVIYSYDIENKKLINERFEISVEGKDF